MALIHQIQAALVAAVLFILTLTVYDSRDALSVRANHAMREAWSVTAAVGEMLPDAWGEKAPAALESRLVVVPMPPSLPEVCNTGGFKLEMDTTCYFAMRNQTLAMLERSPVEPYCFGSSGLNASADGTPAVLVHAAALTAVPNTTSLLLKSFLATQCCDAVMWFWLPTQLLHGPDPARFMSEIPPHHRGRIVWKELNVRAEYDSIAADFPSANETAVRAMTGWTDLRFVSDWVRLVLMYKYGGMWFDIDTVFLRDLRPLTMVKIPSWGYAGGWGLMNNAAMRLARRPEGLSHALLNHLLRIQDPRPDPIGYWLTAHVNWEGRGLPGYNKQGFVHLSQSLFDYFWFRFLAIESDAMKTVHPEISDWPTMSPSRAWTGFFVRTFNETTVPRLAEVEAMPFLPGALTYHWHNRYTLGFPNGSWSDILNRRYGRLLLDMPCEAKVTDE